MAQLMPLPLTVSCFSKTHVWYRLARMVLDKVPLNGCVCNRDLLLFLSYAITLKVLTMLTAFMALPSLCYVHTPFNIHFPGAFSDLTLLVWRQEGRPTYKIQTGGVLAWLSVLHMAQLMPPPLTVSCFGNIQIGFTLLYWLTRTVPDKGTLNGRVYVCILR